MEDRQRDAWLTLDEAAKRSGVARIRLREAIAVGLLRARRDNSGLWRVFVEEGRDLAREIGSVRIAPDQLVDVMFDEIEELSTILEERDGEIQRLDAVAARQQALLERAVTLAETPRSGDIDRLVALNERSQALVGATMASLEARDAELQRMTGLMDRALDTAAGLDAEVARQRETTQKQRALLDRVFEIARISLDRIGAPTPRGGWFERFRGRRANPKASGDGAGNAAS